MKRTLIALLLLTTIAGASLAENWTNWRGPGFNGVAPKGDFPTAWNVDQNISWKVELPGAGSSTPAIWEDNVLVTANDGGFNLLLCLDRAGEEKWRTQIGSSRDGKHRKASGSNPSPITDGEAIYVYYKSGDLACLDFTGKVKWISNVQEDHGEDTLWWDLGTSPVLTKDSVVIAVMQTGPSFLLAIDKETGKQSWKTERNLDAPLEAAQSYSTPIVVNDNGKESLIVLGADYVTGHDASSGKELWRVGTLNPNGEKYWRSIASPVLSDGMLLAPYARGKTLTAINITQEKPGVAYTIEGICADVPTPIAINGAAICVTDRGLVTKINVKTGEQIWQTELEKARLSFSASPILAGKNIYLTREDGATFVVNAENGEVVAKNTLAEEFTVSTPVFADGQILVRTMQALYCIGK
ncbi:PQQ-binding-like beta-propeller repeat protein [Pirellulaceae bacterium]|nr:PQQ-binding-like beta-propeller repeat protein [Pirellulaceae bacterium]